MCNVCYILCPNLPNVCIAVKAHHILLVAQVLGSMGPGLARVFDWQVPFKSMQWIFLFCFESINAQYPGLQYQAIMSGSSEHIFIELYSVTRVNVKFELCQFYIRDFKIHNVQSCCLLKTEILKKKNKLICYISGLPHVGKDFDY